MPVSKLKNCVIVLLVILNLALAAAMLQPKLEHGGRSQDEIAAICSIYAARGITLNETDIPTEATPSTLSCTGDEIQSGLYQLYSGVLFAPDGTQITGGFTQQSSADTNAATIMIAFLNAILDSGDVFSRVDSIETGYTFVSSRSKTFTLQSVWRFHTDTAVYDMNLVTGSCARVTE